jgi:two-component system response regulator YesN
MYRVLLVDDESIARDGLRSTFDWEGYGFELVGEASNGRKAMKWIEAGAIDILITDIAMPVMDGLELTRETLRLCPWVKVLLLSCHSDFEYVREGIRLGASDYLLKPTLEPENLKDVLNRMKLQVIKEKEKLQLYDKANEQRLRKSRTELEKIANDMLSRGENTSVSLNIPWLHEGYSIVVCLPDYMSEIRNKREKGLLELTLHAQDLFYEVVEQGIAFMRSSEELILLLPNEQGEEAYLIHYLEKFSRNLKVDGYSFTMGVSPICNDMKQISDAYKEARNAAWLRFYHGPGGIHTLSAANDKPDHKDVFAKTKSNLKECIGAGFKEKADQHLEALFHTWTCDQKGPIQVLQEAREIVSLFYLCKEDNVSAVEQIEALRSIEYKEEVLQILRLNFDKLWYTRKLDETLHQRTINEAIIYINNHFTEVITLQDVADLVKLSKNYFSELFKRETGLNFIDYIIQQRVKRAKKLLQTTRLNVYEIAEKSGFNDVKYFSKLFKKLVGMSPKQYQCMNKENI